MRPLLLCIVAAVTGCGSSGNNMMVVPDLAVADLPAPGGDLSTAANACDPVKQNCTDAANPKCTLKNMGTMTMPDNQRDCVPLKGMKKEGEACTRVVFGDDDCDKGLACTLRGSSATALRCRKFCHADSDCSGTDKCTGQLAMSNVKDGLCVPTCTPYGTECTSPFSCGGIYQGLGATMQMPKLVLTCRATGASPINGACMSSDDCVAGGLCDPAQMACIPFCDDNHLCPATLGDGGVTDGGGTLTCNSLGKVPNNGGVCQ